MSELGGKWSSSIMCSLWGAFLDCTRLVSCKANSCLKLMLTYTLHLVVMQSTAIPFVTNYNPASLSFCRSTMTLATPYELSRRSLWNPRWKSSGSKISSLLIPFFLLWIAAIIISCSHLFLCDNSKGCLSATNFGYSEYSCLICHNGQANGHNGQANESYGSSHINLSNIVCTYIFSFKLHSSCESWCYIQWEI